MRTDRRIKRVASFIVLVLCVLVMGRETTIWANAIAKDGTYQVEVTLEGGTGRASITSPTKMTVQNGKAVALLQWSSPYYDYMIVDGKTYEPINQDGNSQFEIPVSVFDTPVEVIADTTAMSVPHEITYTLTYHVQNKELNHTLFLILCGTGAGCLVIILGVVVTRRVRNK